MSNKLPSFFSLRNQTYRLFPINEVIVSSSIFNPMKPFNPHGLKALLVDQNATSLFLLSKMLKICQYQVTPCSEPTEALSLIRNNEIKFDIVITEITFTSEFNGIRFLDIIVQETDLPVVIVSADDRNNTIMKCVTKGACVYITKPVKMEVFKLLWQHVARKEISRFGPTITQIDNVGSCELDSSNSGVDKEFYGSSDEQEKAHCKKQRLVWTDELHQKFVEAVKQLGINNAVPKKVLELMNVPGLRRENVASHLQKYRLNLRKLSAPMQKSYQVPDCGAGVAIHKELNVKASPIVEIQSQCLENHCDIHPIIFPFQDFSFGLHDEA